MHSKIPPIADFAQLGGTDGEKLWEDVNKGWTPGKEGKGLFVNGKLYHWNVQDEELGWPHHHQITPLLNAVGEPVYNHGSLRPDVGLIYYIDPDGKFDTSHPEHSETISQIDPRLKADPEGWKFGGYWTDQRQQDFPEDFEAPIEADDGPKEMTRPEIHEFIQRGWEPGTNGKAIIDESGRRYDWTPNKWGQPHHHEVEDAIRGCVAADEILIDPDGTEHSWRDIEEQVALDEDARHQGFGGGWVFSSTLDGDRLDWEEGQEGKGILDGNGHLFTWDGDEYETHNDYILEHSEVNHENAHYLYISPHGKVSTVWGTLTPELSDLIREADPRLYVDLDQGNGVPWAFGA